MKKAQNICTSFDQKDVVISFDLAIYSKAKQIIWKYPDEFPDTLIRLGGSHITLNFLAVLGKRYQSSGIEDALVESGAYGPGTVTSLMKGKSQSRSQGTQANHGGAISFNVAGIHSNRDQKGLVSSMQSFHLAIKSKEDVPQRCTSITVELKTVMELFETFREQERARLPMFSFWDEYIRMVMMLLQFVKAEKTRNWHLHLAAASSMTPYFFAHDRHNYSRWLPVYLADI